MKTFLIALLATAASAMPVSAAVIHYDFQGLTFNDGTTATGWFDYDVDAPGYFSNVRIATTQTANLPGGVFTSVWNSTADSVFFGTPLIGVNLFFNAPAGDLGAGGVFAIKTTSHEFENLFGGIRYVASGSIVAAVTQEPEPAPVPEPAMLGLFGLGALSIGLTRRKARA